MDQGPRESAADKADPSYDCKNGVRCIKVSPDGKQLASGDRQGNIRSAEMWTGRAVSGQQKSGQACNIRSLGSTGTG